jgi:hypothetical protein
MIDKQTNNWKNIWDNREIPALEGDYGNVLSELIKINGFDGGSGKSGIIVEAWNGYIQYIKNQLGIQDNDSLFEIGCGCGAILYPFYNAGYKVGGIDYSSKLIQQAKTIMPHAELITGDASDVNDIKYDFVISNSIFFYFSNYDYSLQVINNMFEKAKKGIAVLDVPDIRLKEQCENERRRNISDYSEKYKYLEHLYYSKKWFLDFAEEKGCTSIILTRQNITGYGYNNYRFNCFMLKSKNECI